MTGKVALVTAAAGGFGSTVAMGLAEHGADIAVTDIREEVTAELAGKIQTAGRRAISAKCDITSRADIDVVVDRTVAELGRIDILINIAGCAAMKPILEMSPEQFDMTVDSSL